MSVEETTGLTWTEAGESIECQIDSGAFGPELETEVTVRLNIDEVLEEFGTRRVLVASVDDIEEGGVELDDESRQAVLHPTYLIEENARFDSERDGRWPQSIRRLIREPIAVEITDGIKRSIFVDNVGVSVGDLVDLVRGELSLDQLAMIFRAVGELFADLHDEGWVHLGLTPWNVRVFDSDRKDGFPQAFVAERLHEGSEPSEDPVDEAGDSDTEVDDDHTGEAEVEDNPFAGVGRDRTVVELNPLGVEHDDEAEPDTDENLDGDSETSWSDLSGDTAPAEADESELHLVSILDGIDRLYRAGEIDDEIAVTPGFSAPELLSGMGSEDGESADVFSLGMFLYFLVSGVVPPASVYTRYAPAIPARNFRPDFPPGLQSVISRATRPQPEDRYASVQTMLEAFEDALEIIQRRRGVAGQRPPEMELASDTHIGIAKRERNPTNQDSVFSASSEDEQFALVVVADGVSTASYGSGDLASNALTEVAADCWEEILPAYLMDEEVDEVEIIRDILSRANDRIVKYVNEHHTPFHGSPHEVMGSTALVAVISEGMVTLGSLGDSRGYLQRGAGLEQITIDHNLWTLSILEGVEADSALAMPHGDALARCLGTFVIEEGRLEAVEPEPDIFRFQVTDGDSLLLTTDGLVDFAGTNLLVAEDNILSVLLSEPDPALACLEFILLANRGGGGDNIGLSVVRFGAGI